MSQVEVEAEKGTEQVLIEMNMDHLSVAQVSEKEAVATLRSYLDGYIVSRMPYKGEELDVVFKMQQDELQREELKQVPVLNNSKRQIQLGHIAEIKQAPGQKSIYHYNGMRVLDIEGQLDESVVSQGFWQSKVAEILTSYKKQFPSLILEKGGNERDRRSSLLSLKNSLILTIVAIFLLLVLQFQNLIQPFIVIYSIPLVMVSVFWVFYFHGMPMSFLGIVGVVALAGVVVNNGIVFLDAFNQKLERYSVTESVILAAQSRLRPILLTTLTTGVGILPTAYGLGGLDAFVVPIAMSLGWGVMIGSVMTLIALPAMLVIVEDIRNLVRRRKLRMS